MVATTVVSSILDKFGLVLEYGKMKVFYFSRVQKVFNPLSLDLLEISSSLLKFKDIWRYLGLIFDRKLLFHQHISFYVNKAISTIKYIKSSWKLHLRLYSPTETTFIQKLCPFYHPIQVLTMVLQESAIIIST